MDAAGRVLELLLALERSIFSTVGLVNHRHCLVVNSVSDTPVGVQQVLIAVDAAGRVLELLLALERAWGGDQQLPYPLALCSAVAKPAVENAKAQLPWLADRLQRSFEADRDNPFALKWVLHLPSPFLTSPSCLVTPHASAQQLATGAGACRLVPLLPPAVSRNAVGAV